ncbi:hypothetical protein SCYAM73S_02512 [Streptomyces cyaneofuscatus]
MSRHLFGLSAADLAMEKVGDEVRLRAAAVGTVWDALVGGNQVTDLTDLSGTPITQAHRRHRSGPGLLRP